MPSGEIWAYPGAPATNAQQFPGTLGGFARADGFDRGLIGVRFDDGWTSQHKNALPILEKYGIPATMYIISGAINDQPAYMTQAQIQDFADRGHEIASHSVTHPHLPQLSAEQLSAELTESQATQQHLADPRLPRRWREHRRRHLHGGHGRTQCGHEGCEGQRPGNCHRGPGCGRSPGADVRELVGARRGHTGRGGHRGLTVSRR